MNKYKFSPIRIVLIFVVISIFVSLAKGLYKQQRGDFASTKDYQTASITELVSQLNKDMPIEINDYLTQKNIKDVTSNSLTVVYSSEIPEGIGNMPDSMKTMITCDSKLLQQIRRRNVSIKVQVESSSTGEVIETMDCP